MATIMSIKWVLLTLVAIEIGSIASFEFGNSKFSETLFDPFLYGTEVEKIEVTENDHSRVKRQISPCPLPPINCNNVPNVNKFRTIDGTCNNLNNPYWGASNIPFIRYLQRTPSGDGFRCPGCPNPRDVSFLLHNLNPEDHLDGITVMVMQWGQFVDHDLVFTPEDADEMCCHDFLTLAPTSASCSPIDVTGDPFYGSLSPPKSCLPFVRSVASNCAGGTDRENVNALTAYLDGSMVYGSTTAESNNLRSFSGGRLKIGPGSETLPCGTYGNVCPRTFLPVRNNAQGLPEFFAGDVRVEEQPALTSLHTAFVRLHNDLASFVNCGSDEATFQATRKIVGAIVQQITFNEFLPIVLGQNIMSNSYYGLALNPATTSYNTFNNGYSPNIVASAPNVFATAAFRFGHSLVPDEFILSSGNTVRLRESFNNHDVTLNPNSFPSHFLGSIITHDARPMDHILVDAVTNKLFATSPFNFGSDLFARNIQRGRDHGIPGYVFWYNSCYPGSKIKSFNDLYNLMPAYIVDSFIQMYTFVEDIDLFPGGIAETEVPGGLVGPTFACLITEHFASLKYGDRFWFEKQGVFSLSQVQSLRRTYLSSIICLYTNVQSLQNLVMKKVSPGNPVQSCSDILKSGVLNDITFNYWQGVC